MRYNSMLLVLLFVVCSGRSQTSGSAYSVLGIGDVSSKATASSRSMQELSTFRDSINANIQNPASYADLKLVNFAIGGHYRHLKLQNDSKTESLESFRLGYVGLAFKVTKKLGVGFGIKPYSTRSYKIITLRENTHEREILRGVGGVNRFYLPIGYKITKNFNVGIMLHYNFGRMEDFRLSKKEGVQLSTHDIKTSEVGGVSYTLSATYKAKILKKFRYYAGVIFSPQAYISSKNREQRSTIDLSEGRIHDTYEVDLSLNDTDFSTITIPKDLTLGMGFGMPNKWHVGFEYHYNEQSKFNSHPIGIYKQGNIQDVTYYVLGGYFIPKFDTYDNNFFKRTIYRAGLSYGGDRVPLPNGKITKLAASFGLGIPIGVYNKIDIGFEYRSRSSDYYRISGEGAYSFIIGLSLSDLWFQKSKYN